MSDATQDDSFPQTTWGDQFWRQVFQKRLRKEREREIVCPCEAMSTHVRECMCDEERERERESERGKVREGKRLKGERGM